MRLLFDANLSPQLPKLLADVFAGSVHVTEIGGLAADDLSIWAHARDNGLTIVSKDSDFHRMSFVLGAPPKGYLGAHRQLPDLVIEHTLRYHLTEIELFEQSEDAVFLILDPPILRRRPVHGHA